MTKVREYQESDVAAMASIWNEIIEEGIAFPQLEGLTENEAVSFFARASYAAVCLDESDTVLGLYILKPNNVGRCGHIANATYAVKSEARGQKIGELLVRHSTHAARNLGFRLMQFNAVVVSNYSAVHLYEKLGFNRLGVIPGGFLLKNGKYEDIILYYLEL